MMTVSQDFRWVSRVATSASVCTIFSLLVLLVQELYDEAVDGAATEILSFAHTQYLSPFQIFYTEYLNGLLRASLPFPKSGPLRQ